jgi:hypothetical protein
MPNYVVIGRLLGPLSMGDPFKPDGIGIAMRVLDSNPGEGAAVVNTSLPADDAEKLLEEMRRRGHIDSWREEFSGWVPLGTIYPMGDEGTIREHFPTVGIPKDALLDVCMGIADTGTPPAAAQDGPLSEYTITSLDGATDTVGHATACVSCMFARRIVCAQALPNGSGSESSIARAIRALADYPEVKVINLSLGFPGQNPPRSVIIDGAVAYTQSKGILCGAAAGNSGWNAGVGSPQAVCDFVWGASTLDGSAPATFSSGGSNWDIETGAIPGQGVGVAHLDGGYGLADGTSFSAPLGNSLALAMYERNAWLPNTIRGYVAEHMRAYSPPRKRGLVVVNADDLGLGAESPGTSPGWRDEIDGIASEVWRIANDAQLEADNGNLWAGVNGLGPVKDYMDQIKALLPKVPEPPPVTGPDEDWANLLSQAPGLAGKRKWYSGPNANGIDIFVKRGTIVRAPFAGTVKFEQVPGGPMPIGQLTLTHQDGRTVRYRHVAVTQQELQKFGMMFEKPGNSPGTENVQQGQALSVVLVNDPSMDILRWPPGYPTPPDGFQHLDLALASHPSRMDPTGGAGGDVNAYAHIWGKMGGIPHIQIIDRTPGPQEGLAGHSNSWSQS